MIELGVSAGVKGCASPRQGPLARRIAGAMVAWMLLASPVRGDVTAPAVVESPTPAVVQPPPRPIATEDAGDRVSLRTAVAKVDHDVDAEGLVERHLGPAVDLVAGDELRYAIRIRNESSTRLAAGRVQVINAVPAGTRFLPGSAGGDGALVEYALDGASFSADLPPLASSAGGVDPSAAAAATDPVATRAEPPGPENLTIRWTYQQELEPGAATEVFFHVRLL